MSQEGVIRALEIVGGLLGAAGVVACCACAYSCRRRRRRVQRRHPASDPDLELGRLAHVVGRHPPTAVDAQVGRRTRRRDVRRGTSPPRRSRSAPPMVGRVIQSGVAAPPPSPHQVVAPPSPAGTEDDFIVLDFDADGGRRWSHSRDRAGAGAGEIIDDADDA